MKTVGVINYFTQSAASAVDFYLGVVGSSATEFRVNFIGVAGLRGFQTKPPHACFGSPIDDVFPSVLP